MSRIYELIKEKCPNGVEYKKLYEITNWDKRFNGVSQDLQTNILSYKHVSAKLLKSLLQDNGNIKLLSTGLFDGYTTEELANDLLNEGEVISIPSGGSANIKYYNGKFVDSGNILASSKDNELYNLKYIFYVLQSKNNIVSDFFRGSGVQHPSMPDILKIDIPVPPIEVQNEIVRILDKFGELELELELELEKRKKQYEFWREKLLNKNNNIVKFFEISDNVYSGKCSSRKNYGEYPVYGSTGIIAQTTEYCYNIAKILIARVGANAGFVHIASGKYDVTDNTLIIDLKDDVNMKYIYYYLQNYNLNKIAKGGGQSLITAGQVKDLEINIPSLEEQQRIVNILDRFDKLVNDISEGLPAEIESRRKQYEYYRNKLLSFEELINE